MNSLEYLGFENTLISTFNNSLAQLPSLKVLNFARSNIDSLLNDTFEGGDSLEEIDLSGGRIESLHPNAFKFLKKLRALDLSGLNNACMYAIHLSEKNWN